MAKLRAGYAAILIATCAAMLTGCGGSSGNSTAGTTPSGQIQGVATPSSVSVVTANNAQ
jgi:hypothetical protein